MRRRRLPSRRPRVRQRFRPRGARILLHCLKFADRPLESDALAGITDAERQDRFQRTGSLDAADGATHQQQRRFIEARRRRCAALGLDAIERDSIDGVAGEIAAFAQLAIFDIDQRDDAPLAAVGKDGDMLAVFGKRNSDRATAQPSIGADRDAIVRPCRGNRHRSCGRLDTGARQKPAGGQRFCQRYRKGKASGNANNGEAFLQACGRAPQRLWNPGERQPGIAERSPQRLLPRTARGLVDDLRVGEIGEHTYCRLDYHLVSFSRHDSGAIPMVAGRDRHDQAAATALGPWWRQAQRLASSHGSSTHFADEATGA